MYKPTVQSRPIDQTYRKNLQFITIFETIYLWQTNSKGKLWITEVEVFLDLRVTIQSIRHQPTTTVNILRILSPSTISIPQIFATQQRLRHWNIFLKSNIILSRVLFITYNKKSMIMNLLVIFGHRLPMMSLMSSMWWNINLLSGCVVLDLKPHPDFNTLILQFLLYSWKLWYIHR